MHYYLFLGGHQENGGGLWKQTKKCSVRGDEAFIRDVMFLPSSFRRRISAVQLFVHVGRKSYGMKL
jgi:hypothetical protein